MRSQYALFYALAFWFSLLQSPAVEAFSWDASLGMSLGSRRDSTSTIVKNYDRRGKNTKTDEIDVSDVRIDEVSATFKALLFQSILLRASGDLGKVVRGCYHESLDSKYDEEITSQANIRDGYTRDLNVGGGYLCHLYEGFFMGPSGGWAYDFERIKMHHTKTNGAVDYALRNLSYKMTWQGPWIGMESLFAMGCFNVQCGYEYHWSHWKADWLLAHRDIPRVAFSDHRKGHHGSSNSAYVDISYRFSRSWEFGATSRYRYWKIKDGDIAPKSDEIGVLHSGEYQRVHLVKWRSLSASMSLGYYF